MKHILALLVLCCSTIAMGQSVSTGTLRDACRQYVRIQEGQHVSQQQLNDATFCSGFVQGFSNTYQMFGPVFFNDGVTFDQVARVFVKWADENPKEANHPVETSLIVAVTLADLIRLKDAKGAR